MKPEKFDVGHAWMYRRAVGRPMHILTPAPGTPGGWATLCGTNGARQYTGTIRAVTCTKCVSIHNQPSRQETS